MNPHKPHKRCFFAAQVTPDRVFLYVKADRRAARDPERPWIYTQKATKAARLSGWEVAAFCDYAQTKNLQITTGEW